MRRIVAENIKAGMKRRFPETAKVTKQMELLAERMGNSPSQSTIERIIKQEVGASIDTLEDIAKELKMPAAALFVPSQELIASLQVTLPSNIASTLQRRRSKYAAEP